MSGTCTVTPGYTFSTTGNGELVTNPKLNLLSQPLVTVVVGAITDIEVNASGISGTKIQSGTLPLSALTSAAQSRASGGIKNYCPNPQFNEWSNGTSIGLQSGGPFVSASGWTYQNIPAVSGTISQQAITPGSNDTILRDAKYWYQFVTTTTGTGQLNIAVVNIPNARSFSGQTITVSIASLLNSGTLPTITPQIFQYFGTGGSPSSGVSSNGTFNSQPSGTVGQIYSTITVPSVTGKTFGTNNDDYIQFVILCTPSSAFSLSITNVQIELSSSATTFENTLDRPNGQVWSYPVVQNGRLTLTSGTPVITTTTTSANLYYTPYNGSLITLPLANGQNVLIPFTETLLSVSALTASTIYDVFGSYNGGILQLSTVAWASGTARTTALIYSNGMLVLSGTITKRYLGTIVINGSGGAITMTFGGSATGGTQGQLSIENAFNKVWFYAATKDTTSSWTYTTSTYQAANASANNSFIVLNAGLGEVVLVRYTAYSTSNGMIAIGTAAATIAADASPATMVSSNGYLTAHLDATTIGLNTYYAIEQSVSGTITFNGQSGTKQQGLFVKKQW